MYYNRSFIVIVFNTYGSFILLIKEKWRLSPSRMCFIFFRFLNACFFEDVGLPTPPNQRGTQSISCPCSKTSIILYSVFFTATPYMLYSLSYFSSSVGYKLSLYLSPKINYIIFKHLNSFTHYFFFRMLNVFNSIF